jgi:hypothetical protein
MRWVLVVGALLAPGIAFADDDAKRADALFDEGLKLLDNGRTAEACDRLNESRKIASGIGVTLYLADCEERLGHWLAARDLYREGQTLADAKHDPRGHNARERGDSLAARIPTLIVHTSGTTQPAIEIDGETSDTAPHEIDPGRHVVRARTKERTWEHAVDVPTQKTVVNVEVPSFDVEGAPPPSSRSSSFFTPLRIAGIATAGVGAILVTFSFALGADAISKLGASKDAGHCDATNHCDPTGLALRNGADSSASASTALFVVGLVSLAAGATLVFVAPKLFASKAASNGLVLTF